LTCFLHSGPSLFSPSLRERLKILRRRSSSHVNMNRFICSLCSPYFEFFASHISQHTLSCSHACCKKYLSNFSTCSQRASALFCLLFTESFHMRLCAFIQFTSRFYENILLSANPSGVITTTLSPAHSITKTIPLTPKTYPQTMQKEPKHPPKIHSSQKGVPPVTIDYWA